MDGRNEGNDPKEQFSQSNLRAQTTVGGTSSSRCGSAEVYPLTSLAATNPLPNLLCEKTLTVDAKLGNPGHDADPS